MNDTHTWNTRVENNADIPTVHSINAAAFDTPAEADLVDALRTDPAWLPELSIVATDPPTRPWATRC